MAAFVTATKSIIDTDGLEAASIRRVSSVTGYSSATLYLYFKDMGELATMSLVPYLRDYVNDIIETTPKGAESPEDSYRRTWKLFCEHAFSSPLVFANLFFGPNADSLNEIAKKYYELFPEELANASGTMLSMLGEGNLFERNRIAIESIGKRIGIEDHELDIANDLTVSYFHHFLDIAASEQPDANRREELTEHFLAGASFILRS